jgi:hypothetical protein
VDFAFAPGTEPKVVMLQALLRDRTDGATLDTTLVEVVGLTTIAEFIKHVDTTGPLPIDDLVLGSHGSDSGWLEMDLDINAPTATVSYSVVKGAWDDVARRNRLRIPPDMYTTSSGQRRPVRVIIKGCRVGQAPKFVDALKMLFGGKIPVIAPRHFYGVEFVIKTRHRGRRVFVIGKTGSFEHLDYSNEITSPTRLTRKELVKAYRDRHFPQFDGTTPIPDLWDTWIPKDVSGGKRKLKSGYSISFGRALDKGTTTMSGLGEFRHFAPPFAIPIDNPPASVKTLAGFKAALAARPEYQPGWGPTGFPRHEQLGPANADGSPTTFDQFFDSYTWKAGADANPFVWTGIRHEYNVLLPVVRLPMTGKIADRLIYNFFPPRGSGGATFIELLESDPGLFYVSPGA